jgi:hypothetical protein
LPCALEGPRQRDAGAHLEGCVADRALEFRYRVGMTAETRECFAGVPVQVSGERR